MVAALKKRKEDTSEKGRYNFFLFSGKTTYSPGCTAYSLKSYRNVKKG